jgi:hypothetical protein
VCNTQGEVVQFVLSDLRGNLSTGIVCIENEESVLNKERKDQFQ